MKINLWLIEIYWGDLGGFRPCLWVRVPRRWLVIWFGWQRPDMQWFLR